MQRPCLHYKSERGRESGGGEARDHPFPQTSTPAHLHGSLSYDFWHQNETGDRPALFHTARSGPDQGGYSAFSAFGGVSGRSHRETCSGCIVSLTTVTGSAFKPSRSVSYLSLAEKPSNNQATGRHLLEGSLPSGNIRIRKVPSSIAVGGRNSDSEPTAAA